MCISVLTGLFEKDFLYVSEFSFYTAVSFLVLCFANSSCLDLPWLSAHLNSRSLLNSLYGFIFYFISWKVSHSSNNWIHLICFPSLSDHCHSLPDIQFFKNHCFICFVYFCFRQEDISSPILSRSRKCKHFNWNFIESDKFYWVF